MPQRIIYSPSIPEGSPIADFFDDIVPNLWLPSCQMCLQPVLLDNAAYKAFLEKNLQVMQNFFRETKDSSSGDNIPSTLEEFFAFIKKIFDLDTPLCSKCMASFSRELQEQRQLQVMIDERVLQALGTIQLKDSGLLDDIVDVDEGQESLEELEAMRAKAQAELEAVQNELSSLQYEKIALDETEQRLNEYESTLCELHSSISGEISLQEQPMYDAMEREEDANRLLSTLARLNVLNDSFAVWYSNQYITINGICLGKNALQQVEWSDVNAGLGEIALIVRVLYMMYNTKYVNYIPVANGSTSYISTKANQSFVLYFNPKSGNKKSFSQGLQMLLSCIKDLVTYCEAHYNVYVPYPITQDTVGGYDFLCNDYDVWLRALRLLAIDLKKLITGTSNLEVRLTMQSRTSSQ